MPYRRLLCLAWLKRKNYKIRFVKNRNVYKTRIILTIYLQNLKWNNLRTKIKYKIIMFYKCIWEILIFINWRKEEPSQRSMHKCEV